MENNVYRYYEYRRSRQQASFATPSDYSALIDMALDTRDFKWAKELVEKRNMRIKYLNLKKSWER